MEFVKGINVDNTKELIKNDIRPGKVAKILNECFSRQIFEFGVVHADPHSGNIFVRKHEGSTQVILLDHGIYKYLPDKLRISYSYFWKGILTLDEEMIKYGVSGMGLEGVYYRLLAGMVTSKSWNRIMDPNIVDVKERLGISMNPQEKRETQ